jgi:GTP-binding protein EngB required for normal cell division
VSSLVSGAVQGARKVLGRGGGLEARVEGLGQAVAAGRGRLDDGVVDRAEAVVERAGRRLRLSADHTVVALAGATGSGKSSTFNALSGLELARVGVRRPTTSYTTACVFGDSPATELLDWLGIPPRHQVTRDSMLDAGKEDRDLAGLVLLDLPDHDSTEVTHHVENERLVAMADLLVWILDPQKYADAAIHERFLRPLATHAEVMLVVVNHIDEVPPDRRPALLDDVRRLLGQDGLAGVPVLATSARTREGIPELRAEIARRVSQKAATRDRLSSDVAAAADAVAAESGEAKPRELADRDKRDLEEALAQAAGVPTVVEAVRRATTVRSRRATGFPLTSWLSRLRPDPLKRLHLDRPDRDLVAAARSSMPRADQVQRARVESSVRDLSDEVTEGMAPPWVRAVRTASTSRAGDVEDALDRAVVTTDLGVSTRLVRVLQWLLLVLALVGFVWLGALAALSYFQVPVPRAPRYEGWPVPTLMVAAGVAAGILVALLSRGLIAIGSRSRARRADRRLRAAVDEVADQLVVQPVAAELAAHRTVHEGLRAARR